MLQFCLVDVQLSEAYFAAAPLSNPEKENRQAQGRNWKSKWI
jgi:hypothetical protein